MSPEQLIREGKVAAALNALKAQVRDNPADVKLRIFLFQLFCLEGNYEKALNQLNVIGEMSDASLAMVQTYRALLQCEPLREAVFRGDKSPLVLGEPRPWLGEMLTALSLLVMGRFAESQALRAQALEKAATISGTINGDPFGWIADADSRLGPVLEVMLNGKYYWVPFEHISRVDIEPPTDLRDLVWLPATFTWQNGGQCMGFIPSRYPLQNNGDDEALLMARKTDWQQPVDACFVGSGQRMLMTDVQDYSLMDVRSIQFEARPV